MSFLDLDAPLFRTLDAVLSPDACAALIDHIEQLGPEDAPIETVRGAERRPGTRNNDRVIFDDVGLAASLFARLAPSLPPVLHGWRVHGLNERFRGYRYRPGQFFRAHHDGCFRRSADEESMLTVLVYLNGDCAGGETALLELDEVIAPAPGRALVFQHRLLHEGCPVTDGLKYVLRSDVMYRRPG